MKLKIKGTKKGPSIGGALKLKKREVIENADEQEDDDFRPNPKGVHCPSCKAPGYLVGVCMIVAERPFVKGGGLKWSGAPINTSAGKAAWEKQEKSIYCKKCGVKFTYEDGSGLKKLDAE